MGSYLFCKRQFIIDKILHIPKEFVRRSLIESNLKHSTAEGMLDTWFMHNVHEIGPTKNQLKSAGKSAFNEQIKASMPEILRYNDEVNLREQQPTALGANKATSLWDERVSSQKARIELKFTNAEFEQFSPNEFYERQITPLIKDVSNKLHRLWQNDIKMYVMEDLVNRRLNRNLPAFPVLRDKKSRTAALPDYIIARQIDNEIQYEILDVKPNINQSVLDGVSGSYLDTKLAGIVLAHTVLERQLPKVKRFFEFYAKQHKDLTNLIPLLRKGKIGSKATIFSYLNPSFQVFPITQKDDFNNNTLTVDLINNLVSEIFEFSENITIPEENCWGKKKYCSFHMACENIDNNYI